ncbi:hypothetical protein KXD93_00485 [Mucilaginibacter sp. BJC16-A38]|uniref:DUF6263 family protein n=1 Tax=Mucilaginibacter phenanthrenivorans TaxID=1234842 RepID=UPI002157CB54|nr:DUF6263 family protein [Mucilaginibacter phenanthrenivorans]MCR8556094.1 hypothetical protein [Mucilaginibacter phenanthrenivorans]
MKLSFTIIKSLLILSLLLIISTSDAQTVHRDFRFKKGDEFERQLAVKSNCVMQRGSQKLNISTYSAVTKTYKINDVVNGNATIHITFNKVIDSINALGRNVNFNSDKTPDPNSDIQMSLYQLIGKSAIVSADSKGTILAVKKREPVSDTLMAFTGIQSENLSPNNQLEFLLDFPASPFLKKGYTWTDVSPVNNVYNTTYTIYAVTGRTTTITYKTSILKDAMNTRINGVMLIDNDSGVVLKRSMQSVTTGYEEIKGVIYTVIRRSASSEVCYKKTN